MTSFRKKINQIETPSDALVQNDINFSKAELEAAQNPWALGLDIGGSILQQVSGKLNEKTIPYSTLGNIMNKVLALGGSDLDGGVKEVEGDEVIESGNSVKKIKGPSHENGGLDMFIPQGANVFSKAIKIDGVSLADRKLKRESRLKKAKTKAKKGKYDMILRRTSKIEIDKINAEDEQDKNFQELIGKMHKLSQDKYGLEKLRFGQIAKDPPTLDEFGNPIVDDFNGGIDINAGLLNAMGGNQSSTNTGKVSNAFGNPSLSRFIGNAIPKPSLQDVPENTMSAPSETPSIIGKSMDRISSVGKGLIDSFKKANPLSTVGDYVSIAGDIYSARQQMINTLKNRSGDLPNINEFEDFGQDAMDTLNREKQFLQKSKEAQMSAIDVNRRATMAKNRGQSRTVNAMEAFSILGQMQSDRARSTVESNSDLQMANLMSRLSQVSLQSDNGRMSGEERKNDKNTRDRDAFFTAMSKNISTKGQGIQQIGKDLNSAQQNKFMKNLMMNMSKYGLYVDDEGNLKSKNKKN